jgi:hypothetical protein
MRSPSGFKVVVVSLRKAGVIEHDLRAAALRFELARVALQLSGSDHSGKRAAAS